MIWLFVRLLYMIKLILFSSLCFLEATVWDLLMKMETLIYVLVFHCPFSYCLFTCDALVQFVCSPPTCQAMGEKSQKLASGYILACKCLLIRLVPILNEIIIKQLKTKLYPQRLDWYHFFLPSCTDTDVTFFSSILLYPKIFPLTTLDSIPGWEWWTNRVQLPLSITTFVTAHHTTVMFSLLTTHCSS